MSIRNAREKTRRRSSYPAAEVAQDDALKAERAAQATVASASHAKMPEMVGTLMGWIGEGAQNRKGQW